ncbi:hypothetical protein [Humibacter sp. RRB41]|uniref:hypothetical protein n=1 Tax=Humibacter sp. RRB41 TaxID=2919946 RepID=UPI001FAAF51B|nr:hypothetical protein [Humibacter sp. RRB41]
MITHTRDIVTLWPDTGAPERLVWAGRRYRVTDTPTRLEDMLLDITHPPQVNGWRFQGTDEHGDSSVFDVRTVDGGWELIGIYD